MIYTAFLLVCSLIVLGAFLGGFMLAGYFYHKQTKPALNEATEDKKPIAELTEEQKREIRKRQIEVENFFNYNGDVMPDPNEKKYEK